MHLQKTSQRNKLSINLNTYLRLIVEPHLEQVLHLYLAHVVHNIFIIQKCAINIYRFSFSLRYLGPIEINMAAGGRCSSPTSLRTMFIRRQDRRIVVRKELLIAIP